MTVRGIEPCLCCGNRRPSYVVQQDSDPAEGQIHCHCCGASGPLENGIDEAAEAWNRMVTTPTCTFSPDETKTRWDEDDNEIETDEPAEECVGFVCSNCGGIMMFDWGGEMGWFDTEPPYSPHFNYCPYCGRKVATDGVQ